MTKRNNKNINAPRNGSIVPTRRRASYNSSRYHGVNDPVVVSTYTNPMAMLDVHTDGAGNTITNVTLTTVGITASDVATGDYIQIEPPRLPWLSTTSRNFAKYRVTRASLVCVGNVGSTVTGVVSVHSSRDYGDLGGTSATVGTGGLMFDLATLATRIRKIPLNINPDWKVVSDRTSRAQITSGAILSIMPIATVNDLMFSHFNIHVAGGPSNSTVMNMYIEYDIEFANPISVAANG